MELRNEQVSLVRLRIEQASARQNSQNSRRKMKASPKILKTSCRPRFEAVVSGVFEVQMRDGRELLWIVGGWNPSSPILEVRSGFSI